jgi:2-C-methyl-D-erythritol 4-phosphate cytidylyltransferase/2-C-methyl-D-erythritol 2,4-cyclodiphosphate synthase
MTGRRGSAAVVLVAAGSGDRLGTSMPKAFVLVGDRPILRIAAETAAACGEVGSLVVVAPAGEEDRARDAIAGLDLPASVVAGGPTRHDSVRAGLAAVPEAAAAVLIHDAARPFASPSLFGRVLAGLGVARGVVPAVPVPDTVKRVREGVVIGTEDREELRLAQTPQAFDPEALRDAHRRAEQAARTFTDDAAALEWAGYRVRVVDGEPANVKITTREDLERARAMVAASGVMTSGRAS